MTQVGFWATVEVLRRAHFKNPKPVPPPTPLEHSARPVPGPPPRPPAASPDEIRQFFSVHMNPN